MPPVISVENLSKVYRLGQIGTGTFSYDLALWWARLRGKPNPLLKIGETDHGNRVGEDLWALKDVSFTVEQGEVLGIIGRNGAGKSTLLKILSRVTAPTSGKVKIKGRVASLLEVGTGFHPELTGRENIYLNGAILGMTRAEIARKFDEIVDFAEVEKFIDTPVKRYSSGMYMRLAFAVAAHLESEILVVDEVLAVGDAEFQKKCLGKMGEVAKDGRTVIFVSHNMSSIQTICPGSMLFQAGKVIMIAKSEDVINAYLSKWNQELSASKEFLPDSSRPMRLRSIEVTSSNLGGGSFEISERIKIRLKYDINCRVKSSHIICMFQNQDGICVLSTGDADTDLVRLGSREPGHYEAVFDIPPFLLNEGRYTVTISMGVPYVQIHDRYEAIVQFQILDHSSLRKQYQHRAKPGVIGMDIPWMIQRADQ